MGCRFPSYSLPHEVPSSTKKGPPNLQQKELDRDLDMASVKQTRILANRYGITTPPGSKHAYAKRTFVSKSARKISLKRRPLAPVAGVLSDMIPSNQVLIKNHFKPIEIKIGMHIVKIEPTGPSTPELIEEDVMIETAHFRLFLKHVDSLEVHAASYSGNCSRSGSECNTPM